MPRMLKYFFPQLVCKLVLGDRILKKAKRAARESRNERCSEKSCVFGTPTKRVNLHPTGGVRTTHLLVLDAASAHQRGLRLYVAVDMHDSFLPSRSQLDLGALWSYDARVVNGLREAFSLVVSHDAGHVIANIRAWQVWERGVCRERYHTSCKMGSLGDPVCSASRPSYGQTVISSRRFRSYRSDRTVFGTEQRGTTHQTR